MDKVTPFKKVLEKNFNTSLDFQDYTTIQLIDYTPKEGFPKFLLNERVIPMLQMKIIYKFALESVYLIGHTKVLLVNDDEDQTIDLRHSIIKTKYPGERLFNTLLQKFAIAAVIIHNPINPSNLDRLTESGRFKFRQLSGYRLDNMKNQTIFERSPTPKFIFQENKIHIHKSQTEIIKWVKGLIAESEQFFIDFIQEYGQSVGVSHEVYLTWLLKSFPDMIHIRSLSN